jgi:hypothetical protein
MPVTPISGFFVHLIILHGASALFVCLKLQIRDPNVVIESAHKVFFQNA